MTIDSVVPATGWLHGPLACVVLGSAAEWATDSMIMVYTSACMARSILLLFLMLLGGCGPIHSRFEYGAIRMATRARIVMYAPDETTATAAAAAAFARMACIESLISDYRLESEVTTLREAAPGVWVDLSEDLSAVLTEAIRATRQSDGAFDVGCGRMTAAWRLARSSGEQPQDWSRWVRSHGPGSGRLEVRQQQVRLETPIHR